MSLRGLLCGGRGKLRGVEVEHGPAIVAAQPPLQEGGVHDAKGGVGPEVEHGQQRDADGGARQEPRKVKQSKAKQSKKKSSSI